MLTNPVLLLVEELGVVVVVSTADRSVTAGTTAEYLDGLRRVMCDDSITARCTRFVIMERVDPGAT